MLASTTIGLVATGAVLLFPIAAPGVAGAAVDNPAGFSCQELAGKANQRPAVLPIRMQVDSLTDDTILGMDAVAPDDIWAVGVENVDEQETPLVRHYDGSTWTEIAAADPGTKLGGGLAAVTAISADDVWAAGWAAQGKTSSPMLQHWDGTAWTIVATPEVEGGFGAIYAIGPHDIWAVGDERTKRDLSPLTEHFDGKAWTVVEAPAGEGSYVFFGAVTAISGRDVWAVGSTGNGVASADLTEHWDGSAWTVVDSPSPGRGSFHEDYLAGVDVDGAGTVRAVGSWRSGGGGCGGVYALEWNGSAWKKMGGAHTNVQNPCGLSAVTTTTAGDAWAVGFCISRQSTLVEHWDGTTWSRVTSPAPGKSWGSSGLSAVAALSGTDVWAGGTYTPRFSEHVLFEHWDGTTWTVG